MSRPASLIQGKAQDWMNLVRRTLDSVRDLNCAARVPECPQPPCLSLERGTTSFHPASMKTPMCPPPLVPRVQWPWPHGVRPYLPSQPQLSWKDSVK